MSLPCGAGVTAEDAVLRPLLGLGAELQAFRGGPRGTGHAVDPSMGLAGGVPSIPPTPYSPRPMPHMGVPALTAAPPAHPSVCAAGSWSCTDAPCPEAAFCPGDLVYAAGSCLRTCDSTEPNGTCPGLVDGCVCPPGTVFLVGAPPALLPLWVGTRRGWALGTARLRDGELGALGRWLGEVGCWGVGCRGCGVPGSWGI